MKIKYKILWIDDNLNEIQDLKTNFKNKLKNLGFILDVEEKASLDSIELSSLKTQLENYNPYDIIIFDYDLGNNSNDSNGDSIAYELRTSIYTDMIFYSGTKGSVLRKILYDKEIEGVYTIDRSNFVDDAWPIIEDQIKRICDINNMRGVLLDEMSKIDLLMRKRCQTEFSNLDEPRKTKELIKYKEKLNTRKNSIINQVEHCTNDSFYKDIMKPIKVEFNIVRNRLKSIINNDELYGEDGELKKKQDLRNKFAHNMAEFNETDGSVKLNGYAESYGFNEFTKIRKELINLYGKIENTDSETL